MIQHVIRTVTGGRDLSRDEAFETMQIIMDGGATPSQIAAFLIAEKCKGETLEEVTGFAKAMRQKATTVKTKHRNAIDMCGTGGDGAGTFNISTVASFVVAGGGVPVAKHGNRSVSSRCGSADLLETLGVNISLSAEQIGVCLDELGIAFLFAPALHKAMKHAVVPRREIGVRTVFNLLGPMTNPAAVTRQVMGVYHPDVKRLVAEVFRELGAEHIFVVHSADGLDEVSIYDATPVIELKAGRILERRITPEDFGLVRNAANGVQGGSPEENAQIVKDVLGGQKSPARDFVIANAACGFVVGGAAQSLKEGAELAAESIDSRKANEKLQALIEMTQAIVS